MLKPDVDIPALLQGMKVVGEHLHQYDCAPCHKYGQAILRTCSGFVSHLTRKCHVEAVIGTRVTKQDYATFLESCSKGRTISSATEKQCENRRELTGSKRQRSHSDRPASHEAVLPQQSLLLYACSYS